MYGDLTGSHTPSEDDQCARCGAHTPASQLRSWDAPAIYQELKTVTCLRCLAREADAEHRRRVVFSLRSDRYR